MAELRAEPVGVKAQGGDETGFATPGLDQASDGLAALRGAIADLPVPEPGMRPQLDAVGRRAQKDAGGLGRLAETLQRPGSQQPRAVGASAADKAERSGAGPQIGEGAVPPGGERTG